MQPIIHEFVVWFCQFVGVSAVLLVSSHLVAERWRARRLAAQKAAVAVRVGAMICAPRKS